MHAYVINLMRSPERRAKVSVGLGGCSVDYEIVTAIDGRDLDLTGQNAASSIDPISYNKLRPGEVGCALSHMSVYRKILADGLEYAMVLEDDIVASAELMAIADSVSRCLVGAEVVLLCFDSEDVVQVSRTGAIALPGTRQLVYPVHVRQPVSAAAYIITREACARMLERAFPIQTVADDWAHFIQIGCIDRLRCVVPLAVRKDPGFGSTLEYYPESSFKARVLALSDGLGLGFIQWAVAYRRRWIWRRYTRVEFVDDPGR